MDLDYMDSHYYIDKKHLSIHFDIDKIQNFVVVNKYLHLNMDYLNINFVEYFDNTFH